MDGGGGGPRVLGHFRAPLHEGSLLVSPVAPNLAHPEAVREALRTVVESLELQGRDVTVILPGGLARPLLLPRPPAVSALEYSRYRLAPTLPYAPEEALVAVTEVGGDQIIAAAVRRSVVLEYEGLAASVGIRQERLDLAPLCALGALLREPPLAPLAVDLVLGEEAVLLAAYAAGRLSLVRTRLRDEVGGSERLFLEAVRTAAAVGAHANGVGPPLRVVGPGAALFLCEWREQGRSVSLGWSEEAGSAVGNLAELPWIGAAL